ncbi:MAG: 4-hydroxybenzoate 3-monooxygenase [Acetobacteraceae bacterium]|nr:4-hydroxybenzoate 3-monooxygenase [Acetobacteraceae bacterium]
MASVERTQVGIVGAGPAGLLLSHLLDLQGIATVVLEARSRAYVENRIRAGVLEQGTAGLLRRTGVGERMRRLGLEHEGVILRFGGRDHRIDFRALTGKAVTVYSQHQLVRDLIAARLAAGGRIEFEAAALNVEGFAGREPLIRYRGGGKDRVLACDFIAGCDGFHGICRPAIPDQVLSSYERTYPFAWLGILANAPPASHELIYSNHERGFALLSMRSPSVSRLYFQCSPGEDPQAWSDEQIWEELDARLAAPHFTLTQGPITQKGVTPMRSFVVEPMQCGRLFLAGDAAHIVPPTGAKGLNLATADVAVLASGLTRFYGQADEAGLARYSETCLRRVWRTQRFSSWMTSLMHRFDAQSPFERRVQLAELDYLATSIAASTALAENYVGLPFG